MGTHAHEASARWQRGKGLGFLERVEAVEAVDAINPIRGEVQLF
jgi:hypothetical protein